MARYFAYLLLTPFGDAVLSAGLYTVGLKKMTTPRLRPLAFAVQYQVFNAAGAVDNWVRRACSGRHWHPPPPPPSVGAGVGRIDAVPSPWWPRC